MMPANVPQLCSPDVEFQVRSVISRYLYALDAEDIGALATCFAPDVELLYHSGAEQEERVGGREAALERFSANMRKYAVRTHALANLHVVAEGHGVNCVSHVVATVVRDQRVMVRGIRYSDRLVQLKGEWCIRRREHRPLWQYEALRTRLEVPSTALAAEGDR